MSESVDNPYVSIFNKKYQTDQVNYHMAQDKHHKKMYNGRTTQE